MKPILKRSGMLLVCAALLAGCTTSNQSSGTSDKTTTSSTVGNESKGEALLNAVIENSDDNEKAEKAWMNLLQQTVDYYVGSLESEGDGEIYEYQTPDESSFVTGSLLYQTARLDGMFTGRFTSGSDILVADLTDLANSDDQFISGSGVLTSIRGETKKGAVVSLTDTKEAFTGQVTDLFTPQESSDNLVVTNLRDSIINCGFTRTVDPVHNASLYSYKLSKEGSGYRLSLEVKDLDAYKAAATGVVPVVDNLDGKIVLGLDEIEGETFFFDFDQNGVLKEVGNNIYHAVYMVDTKLDVNKLYVNVRNVTDVKNLDNASKFEESIGELLNKDLTQGEDFSIENWQKG